MECSDELGKQAAQSCPGLILLILMQPVILQILPIEHQMTNDRAVKFIAFVSG